MVTEKFRIYDTPKRFAGKEPRDLVRLGLGGRQWFANARQNVMPFNNILKQKNSQRSFVVVICML